LISLPPVGPNNKEEGEVDKILFSGYNQLLDGKNDIIVAIYDANTETDIAIVVITIITRRGVACISLAYVSRYPDFSIKLSLLVYLIAGAYR
jgi:hypothetical protein